MKNALLIALGSVLLAPYVLAQSPASTEVNRIVGARLDVEYGADQTMTTVHIVNISNKIIASVRVSYLYEGGSVSTYISGNGNIKSGESTTQTMNGKLVLQRSTWMRLFMRTAA